MNPESPAAPDRWRKALERDLWIIIFLVVVVVSLRVFVDPDLPGHLAYGLRHFQTGELGMVDPYSYTVSGADWVNHEWAFEWFIAWLYTIAGPSGLIALQVIGWSAAGALVMVLARRSSRDVIAAGLIYILFASTIAGSMGIRPQLATFLLFPLLILLLEEGRRGRARWLFLVPPMFVVWANVHGGFVGGLGVLVLYAAGQSIDALLGRTPGRDPPGRRLSSRPSTVGMVAAVPASILATLANPHGIGLWRWLAGSLGTSRPLIAEWLPMTADGTGVAFVALVLIATVALLRQPRSRIPLAHVLVLGATAVQAALHVRHLPFFTMSVAAFVPGALSALARRRAGRPMPPITRLQHRVLRGVGLVVLVPALLLHTGWPPGERLNLELSESDPAAPYPTGVLRYIEESGIAGNMVAYFDWAQLVLQRYHPDIRVAYDGRFRTVYPIPVEEAYFDLIGNHRPANWRRMLYDWPTEWVLVPAGSDCAARMSGETGWWLVYRDRLAALFRRASDGGDRPRPVIRATAAPPLPF